MSGGFCVNFAGTVTWDVQRWAEQSGFAAWQTSGAPEEAAEQTAVGKKMTAWSFIRWGTDDRTYQLQLQVFIACSFQQP